ncbi:MAG: hypothetical protein A2X18_06705 [Bacteroidetes bacterium GWF2_40_14]|nr:MAG: hypothetical protein A2X18_06705 [Bacteroidetes bacterium GWF2_40_14]
MKINLYILSSLLISLVILSCKKEVTPTLSLSANQADIANVDGKTEISVTSNSNWTATISDIWCTITPKSGNGNGVITITASNNYSSEARTASLQVVCQELKKTTVINQSFSQLTVDSENLIFVKEAGTKSMSILSNTQWQLDMSSTASWLTANITSGQGNGSVSFTVQANTAGPARSTTVIIKYGISQKVITISQNKSQNTAPAAPATLTPADRATNAKTIPAFTWTASLDPENDPVTYTVSYTKDNINWTELTTTATLLYLKSHLSESTLYSWKVKATDSEGASSTSAVATFTTGLKSGYADGEYRIHMNSTAGVNGKAAEILFLGDGYTAADFQEGGLFEQHITEGIDHFFSIEPYKSYKNYFRVYKQAAYSNDSGVTQVDKSITKSTAFSSSFNGGSSISANNDEVFRYAKMIPGVDDARLKKMLVILVINQDRYAGTTFMWSDGTAVALCPVSKSASDGSKFKNVIWHEAGGHGFGGLGDEYINFTNQTLPAANKTEAINWSSYGFFANIEVTSDSTAVKWKHFFKRQGYDEKLGGRVGIYQGAYYYSFGAWRPEVSSCMIHNEQYYNAPSREAMVRKILTNSGYTYDLDEFIRLDVQKMPVNAVMVYTKSVNPLLFVPLAPPVFIRR